MDDVPNSTDYSPTVFPDVSSNFSLDIAHTPDLLPYFPDMYRTVAGALIFFATLPFILFHFRCFPARTTLVVLLGAGLMVAAMVLSPAEAYRSIGRPDRLSAVFLLAGMMVLAEFVCVEGLVRWGLRVLLAPDLVFVAYALRASALGFVLAMFFTPDVACALLLPVLVECFSEQERPRSELETLLLGVVTSATLGGASTLFGGSALAIIAAATNPPATPPERPGRLDLLACFKYLLPSALICFGANLALLALFHRGVRCRPASLRCCCVRGGAGGAGGVEEGRRRRSSTEQELSGLTRAMAGLVAASAMGGNNSNGYVHQDDQYLDMLRDERLIQAPTLETILEDEVLELPECSMTWSSYDTSPAHRSPFTPSDPSTPSDSPGGLRRTPPATSDLTNLASDIYEPSPPSPPHFSPARDGQSFDEEEIPETSPVFSSGTSAAVSRSLGALSAVVEGMGGGAQRGARGVGQQREGSLIVKATLGVVLAVEVALLLAAASPSFHADVGLVPLGGALVVLVLDTLVQRRAPESVLHRIDLASLLLLFFSLYVLIDGLVATRLPAALWSRLGFSGFCFESPTSVAVLVTLVVSMANVIGQVPVALLVLSQLAPTFDSTAAADRLEPVCCGIRPVAMVAWALSVAGNLTLVSGGSGAAVVVDGWRGGSPAWGGSTRRGRGVNYKMAYCAYLKFALPASALSLVLGLSIIAGLTMIGAAA